MDPTCLFNFRLWVARARDTVTFQMSYPSPNKYLETREVSKTTFLSIFCATVRQLEDSSGDGFKYVQFSPLPAKMIQFDVHIFFRWRRWFNHQPVVDLIFFAIHGFDIL